MQTRPAIFEAIHNNQVETLKNLVNNDKKTLTQLCDYNVDSHKQTTPIEYAALAKKWDCVVAIANCHRETDASTQGTRYGSALIYMIGSDSIDLAAITALVNAKASLTWHTNSNNDSLLHLAVKKKHKEVIELLLKHNSNLTTTNKDNKTPMQLAVDEAVSSKDWSIVSCIAKNTSATQNKNDNAKFGHALYESVKHKKLDLSESLLKAGAKTTTRTSDKNKPLHLAVLNNDIDTLNLLLKYKARLSVQNKDGDTALDLACKMNYGNCALALIKASQKNTDFIFSEKSLLAAIEKENYIVTKNLLATNIKFDTYDAEKGNVFIYEALKTDNLGILQLLLEKIDLKQVEKNQEGKDPVEIAADLKATKCLAHLVPQPSEQDTVTSTMHFDLETNARKQFLRNMQTAIASSRWWVKKPGIYFWNQNAWIEGYPAHINYINAKLQLCNFNDENAIQQTFIKIANTLHHLQASSDRHPTTDEFDQTFLTKLNEMKNNSPTFPVLYTMTGMPSSACYTQPWVNTTQMMLQQGQINLAPSPFTGVTYDTLTNATTNYSYDAPPPYPYTRTQIQPEYPQALPYPIPSTVEHLYPLLEPTIPTVSDINTGSPSTKGLFSVHQQDRSDAMQQPTSTPTFTSLIK